VWIDGGYVGYLKELKGSKKVLLLPGEHVVSVRQDGYQDFVQRVEVQPGKKYLVRVEMQRAATQPMPAITATVKIEVNPNRAAVFVDGQFVGHVGEFEGAGRGMLVAPGTHKIRVALPGYQTFETEINALANQKVEVKTELMKSGAMVEDPMLNPAGSDHAAPPPPPDRATPPPPPDRADSPQR
jgi:PEGA domain